jgi:hypothetical protein
MPLPTSGALSLNDIQTEFGGTNPISLNEYYAGGAFVPAGTSGTNGAVPTSGTISILNFYGTQAVILKGYFAGGGGFSSPVGFQSTEIDGIQFSNETGINPSATLARARTSLAGVNSSTRAYFGGGQDAYFTFNATRTYTSEIDGIQFSNEAGINPSAALVIARFGLHGLNSTTRGYFAGGRNANGGSNEIDGIQFDNEAAINPSAGLITPFNLGVWRGGPVSSSTKGYIGGGFQGETGDEWTSSIRGFIFSNETSSNPSATLVSLRNHVAGVNSTTKGYFSGGFFTPGGGGFTTSEIDGIQFSNEAGINPSAALATARAWHTGVNSTTRGYFAGGATYAFTATGNGRSNAIEETGNSSPVTNEIDGIQFDNEAAINPSAGLPVPRHMPTGVQNGGIL